MAVDLTRGPVRSGMLRFSLPLIAGNLLQQAYHMTDTFVVGRYVGQEALAAVGSAFSLMVLLNSIILGLCMGSGVVFSQMFGAGEHEQIPRAAGSALWLTGGVCVPLCALSLIFLTGILHWMNVPPQVLPALTLYLRITLPGMMLTFLYNYCAALLRSVGNSAVPLMALLFSTLLNILLDLLAVAVLGWGIEGAAGATLIAQAASAIGLLLYMLCRCRHLLPSREALRPNAALMKRIASVSLLTSLQQSIMNFGILMIQSLVNSFGVSVMAAFAAGVKIDAFAYGPAQDFANGYATYISQNAGSGNRDRIREGIRAAFTLSVGFCAVISLLIFILAQPLMGIFISPEDTDTMLAGVRYLRTEGACYPGIGILFLLYASYRSMEKPLMSVVLTVISLGLRVLLAYSLAPRLGVDAIWWAIPIGWAIADIVGLAGLPRLLRSIPNKMGSKKER